MLFGLYNAWRWENWNNEYTVQFIDTMHFRVFPISYTKTMLP